MKLKLIQEFFELYKQYLSSEEAKASIFMWESQRIFQENWDIDALKLEEMYDKSLENTKTRRLWKREAYEPKSMMMKFIDLQSDFVCSMFKDLYHEEKEIGGRVDRFIFYCDQLLEEYKNIHPVSIENSHYHNDDYGIVSLYLAFRYPTQYAIYRRADFLNVLQKVGSQNISSANDFPRFVKVSKTFMTLMKKDEDLLRLHRARLDDPKYYQDESLLLVTDFFAFLNQL